MCSLYFTPDFAENLFDSHVSLHVRVNKLLHSDAFCGHTSDALITQENNEKKFFLLAMPFFQH
jgi:hypothetical protein